MATSEKPPRSIFLAPWRMREYLFRFMLRICINYIHLKSAIINTNLQAIKVILDRLIALI